MNRLKQSEIRVDIPMNVEGQTISGCPGNNTLPEDLRYNIPLTRYELITYRCNDDDHLLCHKCYDKIHNRSRFGLCQSCFNSSGMTTLLVSDADEHTVYLTRRGRKVQLVGKMIRIPIFVGTRIETYRSVMERPYVMADNPFRSRDYELQLGSERVVKLHAHGVLPMDYLLAELD